MAEVTTILAGVFLPLFPLSMVFNGLFTRGRHPALRTVLLVVWPQIGLVALNAMNAAIPGWILPWAIVTALLYGLRVLTLREVGLWTGFVASSAWALLWIAVYAGVDPALLQMYALSFSVPLAMLALLGNGLERRFGAAYTGLSAGLAQSMPRFAGVLAAVVLAVVATPLFPGFFVMLAMVVAVIPTVPATAAGVLVVWLLWSWAAARLLQGLIVGAGAEYDTPDLSVTASWAYVIGLGVLVVAGLYALGGPA